jgi:energy-coupling factor transporter ATP-binding protein EcfA2
MLVDFTVTNFRSIREPITLSLMETSPRKRRQKGASRSRPLKTDEEISPALDVPRQTWKVLRAAGLFGPNASGKSNVVKALDVLLRLMQGQRVAKSELAPFGLDDTSQAAPMRFDVRVATSDGLFRYALELLDGQVIMERLLVSEGRRERKLFDRVQADGGTRWSFGSATKASVKAIAEDLRADTVLLGLLVSKFQVAQFVPLTNWLGSGHGTVLADDHKFLGETTAHLLAEYPRDDRPAEFLSIIDSGIRGLRIDSIPDPSEEKRHRPMVKHVTRSGAEVWWPLREESAGNQHLFALALPVIFALSLGGLLILDEFGANLHPHLTQQIVQLFQSPIYNTTGAQLVFNSHDSTLLHGQLLRRDQIWVTERREDGSSALFPLTDFGPRRDEVIDRNYLGGMFGAVPIVGLPDFGPKPAWLNAHVEEADAQGK